MHAKLPTFRAAKLKGFTVSGAWTLWDSNPCLPGTLPLDQYTLYISCVHIVCTMLCSFSAHIWCNAHVQPRLPYASEHELCKVAVITRRGACVWDQPWRPACQEARVSNNIHGLSLSVIKGLLTYLLVLPLKCERLNFSADLCTVKVLHGWCFVWHNTPASIVSHDTICIQLNVWNKMSH